MEILNIIQDNRSQCLSILTKMTLQEYKRIAYVSFENGGNINGQRDVIKKSVVASKIRKRMNDDFISGAVFPPVVLGIVISQENYIGLQNAEGNKDILATLLKSDISIIDGMQRSNIYFNNFSECEMREIRVEIWAATASIRLLYRMLVLNTGQVPWNTRRQVEVVFSNLSKSIEANIGNKLPQYKDKITLMGVDDKQRRTQPGKYQENTIIEMYMGFCSRSTKVDVSEELANEFQRFDMMESIDKEGDFDIFVDILTYLIKLDFAFSECTESSETGQFREGKDLFASTPVCLGFVVACAEYILGKISVNRDLQIKNKKNQYVCDQINKLIKFITQREEPLNLTLLNEVVNSLSKNKIGDEMRNTFKTSFAEMIKCDYLEELETFESFWRS